MGRLYAEGLTELDLPLEDQIKWHLSSNHYPPAPLSMAPVCVAAIEAGSKGDWDREIELPEGISYKGSSTVSALAVIEGFHLDPWLPEVDN